MIQDKAASEPLMLHWPIVIVFARLFFAVVAQSIVAVLFFSSAPSPYQVAGRWWPVYGILIDLGCFLLIRWRARKEGFRFRDLINFDSHRLGRDILLGFVYILWFFPLAMAGIFGFSWLIYGAFQGPSVYSPLPTWASIYSLLIFPAIWGLMEQCTYQGYALSRLDALFHRQGLAVAIVAFGWCIQHIALPMKFDIRFVLFRLLSFAPLAVVMPLIYLRTRRLIPFIVAHWLVDMLGILSGIILPMP